MKLTIKDNQNICNEYLIGLTQTELSEKYNVSPTQIHRILKKYNIPVRPNGTHQRKYNLDENYFDVIDTPEKAYILGLLYADGSFSPTNNTVNLSLSTYDVDILEKINNLIKSNKPIKNYNHKKILYSRISICGKQITKTLNNYGITHRKTYDITYPKWLPKELNKHFIRGYFDGDGSIYHNKSYTEIYFSLIGTNSLMFDIQRIIFNELNICGHIKQHKNKINSILEIGGNKQTIMLYDWLYDNSSIHLDRKFNLYKKYKLSYRMHILDVLERKKIVQLTKKGEFIKTWNTQKDLCLALKLDSGAISKCCNGKLKSTGGFSFKYFTDYVKK